MKDEYKLMMDVVDFADVISMNSKGTGDGMRSVCCRLLLRIFEVVDYVWEY